MIQIHVLDKSGNLRYDPEEILAHASGIQFDTRWPKGFGPASFDLRRKAPFSSIPFEHADSVLIWDGAKLLYDGMIDSKPASDGGLAIQCVGHWGRLVDHHMAAVWVDEAALSRTYLRGDPEIGEGAPRINERGGKMTINMTPSSDIDTFYPVNSYHAEVYRMPHKQHVLKVDYQWYVRSGEGLWLSIYNVTNASYDYDSIPTQEEQTITLVDIPLGSPSQEIELRLITKGSGETNAVGTPGDTYDGNDTAEINNFVVYAAAQGGHSNGGIWTYALTELLEDIVRRVDEISNDFSGMSGPTQILTPYSHVETVPAADIIDTILTFGDDGENSWGAMVWGRDGSSDSLPQFTTQQFETSDYEYQVSLNDRQLRSLELEQPSAGLHNYIRVEYTDKYDRLRQITPDDYATLKDDDSIAAEYQRDHLLTGLGQTTEDIALKFGERYLKHHRNRRTRGALSIQGEIQTKQGAFVPATWVRAGDRILDNVSGNVFFIRQASVDVDNETVTIQPDLPIFDEAQALARIADGLI